jgi:DNA-binding HxlR family transcriptional regulator/putative sterol carrier protein
MEYGQFCPIAKATEVIGEKWTILIIRELLMGGSRFSELQRGLSMISPTILTKRLNALVEQNLVVRKRIPGQKGYEYFPTASCRELLPVIKALGDWGMRWTRGNIVDTDYDVELLMLYLQRSIQTDKLIGPETVIRFKFTDIKESSDWWVIADQVAVDVCNKDPAKEVDVYLTSTVPTLVDIWMGQLSYRKAIKEGRIKVVGPRTMTHDIFAWMQPSMFADLPPAAEI